MKCKTKKITAEELQMLQEESNRYTAGIPEKRIRKQANRDLAYTNAAIAQKADAGKKGGLIAGSGYHYDRAYNGHSIYHCDWFDIDSE
jgi:hypothetical protein